MMNKLILEYNFLQNKVCLTYGDILWAYKNGILGWRTVIQLSIDIVMEKDVPSEEEVNLISVEKDNTSDIIPILEKIQLNKLDVEEIKRKWLYLLLQYLYNLSITKDKKMGILETVYADFDYPDAISHFIPFLPEIKKIKGEPKKPDDRILYRWNNYLDEERKYFKDKI